MLFSQQVCYTVTRHLLAAKARSRCLDLIMLF